VPSGKARSLRIQVKRSRLNAAGAAAIVAPNSFSSPARTAAARRWSIAPTSSCHARPGVGCARANAGAMSATTASQAAVEVREGTRLRYRSDAADQADRGSGFGPRSISAQTCRAPSLSSSPHRSASLVMRAMPQPVSRISSDGVMGARGMSNGGPG